MNAVVSVALFLARVKNKLDTHRDDINFTFPRAVYLGLSDMGPCLAGVAANDEVSVFNYLPSFPFSPARSLPSSPPFLPLFSSFSNHVARYLSMCLLK